MDVPATVYAGTINVSDNLFIHPGVDKSLMVWDMGSQKELGRLTGHDKKISAAAARGNLAISAQYNGPLCLWSLETMRCTATLAADVPGMCSVFCMEGKVLLGSAGPIKLWDIAASAPVALPDLEGHTEAVRCVRASTCMVLSGSWDKTVRLWDLRTGKCVRTMEGHTDVVCSVDMDGHCHTAVSGSSDSTVRLWDLGSGRCSATFEGHSGIVQDVVMHESGSSFLSSGYTDFTVNAWAVGSDKATMTADLKAFSTLDKSRARLFASRDLSRMAYCCLDTSAQSIELRYWR